MAPITSDCDAMACSRSTSPVRPCGCSSTGHCSRRRSSLSTAGRRSSASRPSETTTPAPAPASRRSCRRRRPRPSQPAASPTAQRLPLSPARNKGRRAASARLSRRCRTRGRSCRSTGGAATRPASPPPACLARAGRRTTSRRREFCHLLHLPLRFVGVSIRMERGCHQNDSLADG